ncbi:methylenetetrahydrofolate reductase [Streptomyces sp. NPDC056844]|uniref:methylenetetrahydrofolate reductase n=1 Tax=unclassified Streptomyces TaxID=2593676 RepID=UPI0036B506D3
MNSLDALPVVRTSLLDGFSLEITGKDAARVEEAAAAVPSRTRIHVTFLGNEDPALRLAATRAVQQSGFVPVPHLSARRLGSAAAFEEYLAALRAEGACERVFTVGGDPAEPEGPYPDALSLIGSGLLQRHGVREVGIAGYPEGHPDIPDGQLWQALTDKGAALAAAGLDGQITTQFGFDPDPVLAWIEEVRRRGITLPIRIGVPGPAGVRRLLGYAARFGISSSASIAKKYGLSLTNLMGTAGPGKFLDALDEGYDPRRHGEARLHFYTFGGLAATAEWIAAFRKEHSA